MNSILDIFREVPFTLWLVTAASLLATVAVASATGHPPIRLRYAS